MCLSKGRNRVDTQRVFIAPAAPAMCTNVTRIACLQAVNEALYLDSHSLQHAIHARVCIRHSLRRPQVSARVMQNALEKFTSSDSLCELVVCVFRPRAREAVNRIGVEQALRGANEHLHDSWPEISSGNDGLV